MFVDTKCSIFLVLCGFAVISWKNHIFALSLFITSSLYSYLFAVWNSSVYFQLKKAGVGPLFFTNFIDFFAFIYIQLFPFEAREFQNRLKKCKHEFQKFLNILFFEFLKPLTKFLTLHHTHLASPPQKMLGENSEWIFCISYFSGKLS